MDNMKWIALGTVGAVAAMVWATKKKQASATHPSMVTHLGSTNDAWSGPYVRGSL
jgi:hypothetical protein